MSERRGIIKIIEYADDAFYPQNSGPLSETYNMFESFALCLNKKKCLWAGVYAT